MAMRVDTNIRSLCTKCFGARRWSWWLGFLGLIVLFCALRWNSYDAPLTQDEGEYAYSAFLLENGLAPYEHAFIQKPPMVIYSYAFAYLIAPHVFWAPRLLAYLFVAVATLLIGFIARDEFGKSFAWPTMFLTTPMILLPEISQFLVNTEMFMLLPLFATIAIYVHSRKLRHGPNFLFAAGFFGTVAFLYKYTTLPLLGFVYLNWLVELWRRDAGLVWRRAGSFMLGVITAIVLVLGYFLAQDGGARLWECTIEFNRHYVQSELFGWHALYYNLKIFWPAWWMLFLIPCALFLKPRPRTWFWLSMFALACLSTGSSVYGQYYILVMPFWALLNAIGLCNLVALLDENSRQPLKWAGRLLLLLVLILVIRPDVPWLTCSRARFAEAKLAGYPFLESQLVAKRAAELSSANDWVYVAGAEPQILYYAKRFSPTRFITVYPQLTPTPSIESYQREAMLDLVKRPPKIIVLARSSTSWPRSENTPPEFINFINQFLNMDYKRVGGYVSETPQKGRWTEPLTEEEATHASLIIFNRKK